MGDKLSMSEIGTITTLLQDMSKSVLSLHKDFADLKGDINKSLTETNGKLKGNQELLSQRIESTNENSALQRQILEKSIDVNSNDIVRNKNQIANIYELDRSATKRNDDANAKLLLDINTKIDEKFKEFGSSVDKVKDNTVKINILFGASGAMLLAIAVELFSRFKG